MIGTDRNFDNLADRFEQRIHGSWKGRLREDLLWWHMLEHMPELDRDRPLRLLDAGGGLGQMTLRLAQRGHRVTLNDISTEMLDRARQRLDRVLPDSDRIDFHPGPAQGLYAGEQALFDAIVCHALLEWLAQPRECLRHLCCLLKPGGKLSLAFYNRHALVYASARKGNVDVLLPDPDRKPPRRKGLSPRNAQYPETVLDWLQDWRLPLLGYCGVRVLSDWLPAGVADSTPYGQLLATEQHYARLEPYCYTGRYFHLVVEKPANTLPTPYQSPADPLPKSLDNRHA